VLPVAGRRREVPAEVRHASRVRRTVLRAEALEEQLVKSRKHAAAMQSKLDTAFAQYHNDIQDMQAKSDELM
jgi:hypothetical protein